MTALAAPQFRLWRRLELLCVRKSSGNDKALMRSLSYLANGSYQRICGDSGYTQRPYLMVPVQNTQDGSPEHYYNQLHSTARNTVERTIGKLKGRFRCLLVHRVLHYDPDMVAKIVIACCVLHNICNSAGLPAVALQESDQQAYHELL